MVVHMSMRRITLSHLNCDNDEMFHLLSSAVPLKLNMTEQFFNYPCDGHIVHLVPILHHIESIPLICCVTKDRTIDTNTPPHDVEVLPRTQALLIMEPLFRASLLHQNLLFFLRHFLSLTTANNHHHHRDDSGVV